MNFLTTTLPLPAYLFTFAVFVTLLSYMYKTALVSVAAALIFHETTRYSYKKKKENILTHLTFFWPTDPNTPFSETRDCVTKNFKTHPWHLQNVGLKGFCTDNIGEKMANTENETVAKI